MKRRKKNKMFKVKESNKAVQFNLKKKDSMAFKDWMIFFVSWILLLILLFLAAGLALLAL